MENHRNILVTTSTFAQFDKTPLQMLEKAGYRYVLNPYGRKVTEEELLRLVGDCVGVIAGTENFTADVLRKISSVKAIARCGSGLNNIDLAAAKKLSISVTNTLEAPTQAVAELTLGLILSLLRKMHVMDRKLREGQWEKMMGHLLLGKNVGIIGYGRIGQKLAELLRVFEVHLAYYDVIKKETSTKCLPLKDLLGWADIVCIHASNADGFLLDKAEFECMKKGAWLINCSRGELINEDVLVKFLEEGKLAGAALDVFAREPYSGPLTSLDNVILTPHIGSYAIEARVKMEIDAVDNLLKSLNGIQACGGFKL